MRTLTRDGTAEPVPSRPASAEPVSQDQILRRERGQGKNHFSCSADHEQGWQPYQVDPYSRYMCEHTYIHTFQAFFFLSPIFFFYFLVFILFHTLSGFSLSSSLSFPQGKPGCVCLKKTLNAPRPSEHPPVWGKKSKRLGGINS